MHGITLKKQIEELVAQYGFEGLASRIRIKCFMDNPSVQSSLTFLRKTAWAKEKVEGLYFWTFYKRDGTRKDGL